MEKECRIELVWILVEMIDAAGVEGGGPALQPVNLIPLLKKELRKVRSVLSGYSGD